MNMKHLNALKDMLCEELEEITRKGELSAGDLGREQRVRERQRQRGLTEGDVSLVEAVAGASRVLNADEGVVVGDGLVPDVLHPPAVALLAGLGEGARVGGLDGSPGLVRVVAVS